MSSPTLVTFGHSFLHESGEPSDKIHPYLVRGPVQCLSNLHQFEMLKRAANHSNGADGNSLVHYGNTVFLADLITKRRLVILTWNFFMTVVSGAIKPIRSGPMVMMTNGNFFHDLVSPGYG